jgi:hypothetical protein
MNLRNDNVRSGSRHLPIFEHVFESGKVQGTIICVLVLLRTDARERAFARHVAMRSTHRWLGHATLALHVLIVLRAILLVVLLLRIARLHVLVLIAALVELILIVPILAVRLLLKKGRDSQNTHKH